MLPVVGEPVESSFMVALASLSQLPFAVTAATVARDAGHSPRAHFLVSIPDGADSYPSHLSNGTAQNGS